ncbi:MAG: DUF167 family protein [Pseudomonadota bacterium]
MEAVSDTSVALALYIQPKSSKNTVCGLHGSELKLALTAPPLEGKANKALIAYLAKLFGVTKSSVTIISGLQSRHKRCQVEGISFAKAEKIIDSCTRPDEGKK